MASDEARRVLKIFGVAVTNYEDCVEKGAPAEETSKAEAEVDSSLVEVTRFVKGLRAKKNDPAQRNK